MTHYVRNQEILKIVKAKITSDKVRNMKIVFKAWQQERDQKTVLLNSAETREQKGNFRIRDGIIGNLCCKPVLPEGKGNNFFISSEQRLFYNLEQGVSRVRLFLYHRNWDIKDTAFFSQLYCPGKLPQCLRKVLRSQNWQDSFWKRLTSHRDREMIFHCLFF